MPVQEQQQPVPWDIPSPGCVNMCWTITHHVPTLPCTQMPLSHFHHLASLLRGSRVRNVNKEVQEDQKCPWASNSGGVVMLMSWALNSQRISSKQCFYYLINVTVSFSVINPYIIWFCHSHCTAFCLFPRSSSSLVCLISALSVLFHGEDAVLLLSCTQLFPSLVGLKRPLFNIKPAQNAAHIFKTMLQKTPKAIRMFFSNQIRSDFQTLMLRTTFINYFLFFLIITHRVIKQGLWGKQVILFPTFVTKLANLNIAIFPGFVKPFIIVCTIQKKVGFLSTHTHSFTRARLSFGFDNVFLNRFSSK